MRKNHLQIVIAAATASLAAFLFFWFGLRSSGHASEKLPTLEGEAAIEHLKEKGIYSSLAEAMEAARYKVYPAPPSQRSNHSERFYANNPRQGYQSLFSEEEMKIVTREGEQTREWRMKLSACGYDERMMTVTEGEMKVAGNRIEIERAVLSRESGVESQITGDPDPGLQTPDSRLVEWYINGEEGLEQGFSLSHPPGERGERLRLKFEVSGNLRAEGDGEGKEVTLKDEHGEAVITYSKLRAWDRAGRELESSMRMEGSRLWLEVEDEGAEYPIEIDPVFAQVRKLTASDGATFDFFGFSVSISGDTAIVGAPLDNVGLNGDQGSAYIFTRNTGGADQWGEVAKLTASDGAANDQLGWTVSISGDMAIVGAHLDNVGMNLDQGSAYIFSRNEGGADNWGEVRKLTASDGAAFDSFGQSVSIDGDTAIIGVNLDDVGMSMNQGSAYIFSRNAGGADQWGEIRHLTPSDGLSADGFGASVSISGDVAIVGAFSKTMGINSSQGAAYIFERNVGGANNWGEVKKLIASDGAAFDLFGNSVSISGDAAIVGAQGLNGGPGSAYIFSRNAGGANQWGEVKKLTASDGAANDSFGFSVSISGDTAIVGTGFDDVGMNMDQGSAYIFSRNAGGADQWGEVTKLTASDGAAVDEFGFSVSISGETAIIGAALDDVATNINQGSAYIFENVCNEWVELRQASAMDGEAFDEFGFSVSISGNTAIVGAPSDDVGMNVDQGSAYLFSRNAGGADNWGEVKKLTASDGAEIDHLGFSAAINGDTAIVGAIGDDIRGSAYIFSRNAGGADNWGEVKRLTASDGATDDLFGNSASINGDTAIIGARGDDVGMNFDQGSAYVFSRNAGGSDNWGEVKKLTASDGAGGDLFSFSMSMSGDTVIVGAFSHDVGMNFDQGSAYIFSRNAGGADNWGEVKKLTASDGAMNDFFGHGVSISGDTVIVGAPRDDVGMNIEQGSVYIFSRNTGGADQWGVVRKLTASDGTFLNFFGHGVSISGDTAIVSSFESDAKGALYILSRNAGGADQWGEVVKLKPSGSTESDAFGFSASISGNAAIVGAHLGDVSINGNQGAAYIFTLMPETTPPVITCPGNVSANTTPGGTAVVNYPNPVATDNCSTPTVVCSPPSGSAFPVGITTVTCTATDAAGNQASCNFTVLVRAFDICIQDDSNSSRVLLWNSQTGDYQFCCGSTVITGKGTATRQGNIFKLTHNFADRRLSAQFDAGTKRGNASLQMPPGTTICAITDRDTRNNSCLCTGQ